MADKKVALGKKAAEVKAELKKAEKVLPKKVEEKKSTLALGKKAAPTPIKVETKEVPEIKHYARKEAPKKETTAKLPVKPTGIADKMNKLKTSLKKVVHEAKEDKVIEEVAASPSTQSTSVNQLDIASTRRPVTSIKKGPVAAGRASLEELLSSQQSPVVAAPIPFFDVEKHLKK